MPTALITGSAGFIGFNLTRRLIAEGWSVVGIDCETATYDPALKTARRTRLEDEADYTHLDARIEAPGVLKAALAEHRPEIVVHLAAEAGVRPSIADPRRYVEANILGTFELLEALRETPVRHALLASTSSAYGANTEMPYAETMRADWPVSPYAATKRATEVLAHSHSHIFDLPITMFRFFTVYGPWGRPDMAYYLFTDAILAGRPIKVFNHGEMRRDFVFIDDLLEAILRLFDTVPERPAEGSVPEGDSLSPVAPFRLVNIGKSAPDTLGAFIAEIERALGQEAKKEMLPMQQGDVLATWADASLLERLTGYKPSTPLSEGIPRFVDWYRAYHGKNRPD
ncbi:MAG: SDR family NAD(P)-dependent oxidoreductase [Paracoccaceae bacterium]|nr:SDR family NAD(P)-dependent oxidoreductase [Paracoccaceae bacterium]